MLVKKQATILHALIPILFLLVVLSVSIFYFGADPHIPLILAIIVAALVAKFMLNYSWGEIEEGILDTIRLAMQAILILMVIGTIVGTWILSGTVPAMIYYGLQILSPSIFLLAAALICAIVSLSTGSSWTTAATVGIALMGVGKGLGIPVGMVAGAIVSGAYFGDKLSPLSETTNLAPAMAGSNLFDHIRSMAYTTLPTFGLALILYGILGIRYGSANMDTGQIQAITTAISENFNISPLLIIPPIFVIVIVVLKIPALPGLIAGTVLGGIFAAIFQGASLADIIDAAHYGLEVETGMELVDNLLSRGGLDGMMWTVSLIICALSFGGVLEKTGMLKAFAMGILKIAKSVGSLVFATTITSILVNALTADQYLALVVPGRMYKEAYKERNLPPELLSRTLEAGGTVTSALFPWNTCGAYMMATLGVSPLVYVPFAFLNILVPIVNIVFSSLGIGYKKPTGE
nr:Na+/H+ antiporter NhaC [Anaerobranca gottschalkii]